MNLSTLSGDFLSDRTFHWKKKYKMIFLIYKISSFYLQETVKDLDLKMEKIIQNI